MTITDNSLLTYQYLIERKVKYEKYKVFVILIQIWADDIRSHTSLKKDNYKKKIRQNMKV